ncbi:phage tail spike protein [Tuberibacillus sp. Marseille-P3662]|uniref:phage tail spike protein n=1 Tax=Tuberibacillus sp. Marseille-P3662 TaxID=1965358 RepID=UPI000A1C9612|nr:phage tail spike protein [Tuberibacillus sp. Marseille-P3662]
MNLTTVYDKDMNVQAYLENAHAIDIKTPSNALWKAGFTLPFDDPKNDWCQPFYRVRLYKNNKEVGLFQIVQETTTKKNGQKLKSYKLEHVLATLLDSAIDGYKQKNNRSTSYNIEYLLSFQNEKNWVLGQCDFEYLFSYKYENVNGVYNALMSLTDQFPEPFHWTWDTSVYPWKLNLVRASTEPQARIKHRHNLQSIERDMDPRDIITRIIPKGYGEGVNQLTIESVNNGQAYIDAEPELIEKFGLKTYIMVDRSIEDPNALYNVAKKMLDEYKIPPVSYKVGAADVSPITDSPIDEFEEGIIVEVDDEDFGVFQARIVDIDRSDVTGKPWDANLEIARKTKSITDSQNEMRDRQRINEVISQGATNIDTHPFADNCDPDHPAVMNFEFPEEFVHLNKAYLNFKVEPFRMYSRATAGGGATTRTTSAGGSVETTTSAGGYVSKSTANGGGTTETTGYYCGEIDACITGTSDQIGEGTSHFHSLPGQLLNHSHELSIPDHSHSFNVPSHTHDVSIDPHTHQIELPDHTHKIEPGIWEGTRASSIEVIVDGQSIGTFGQEINKLNLIPYLDKDNGGRVTRSRHTVELKPDKLSRITTSVVRQFFIQSHEGGTY